MAPPAPPIVIRGSALLFEKMVAVTVNVELFCITTQFIPCSIDAHSLSFQMPDTFHVKHHRSYIV